MRTFQSIRLAVVGAHLEGQPLHHQLVELGARFESATQTAPRYRLFALDGTVPAKPGLLRQSLDGGPIDVEVYGLDPAAFGQFVAQVAQPLSIGNVELASGEWVRASVRVTRHGGGHRDHPPRRLARLSGHPRLTAEPHDGAAQRK